MLKDQQIDGNKEMISYGLMNIAGSFTSCYLTTGESTCSLLEATSIVCIICLCDK
jgi:MFS superfamily sulfate permease-like transporter